MVTSNGHGSDLREVFRLDPAAGERLLANIAREIVDNAVTFRRDLVGRLNDRRRNYEHECGHPDLSAGWDVQTLQRLYDRDPIAGAVVDRMPELCWQVSPEIYESEDPAEVTPFEEDVDALATSLRGEESYYVEEVGSPLWDYCERLDKLSRVGSYGVMLLGLDDGLPLSQPVRGWREEGSRPAGKGVNGQPYVPRANYARGGYRLAVNAAETAGRKLLYLRVSTEAQAPILRWENNQNSPRFGQPVAYQFNMFDPAERNGSGSAAVQEVHWTRVIHLADVSSGKASSSDCFATPAMWPVYERILDCRKLYGGSAEMYWLGALPGMVVKTQPRPELSGMVDINKTDTKDQLERFMNGLQRFLILQDLDAMNLAPTVVDPSAQIDVQLTAISIRLAMPKRVLMGSEQGKLAADQDSKGMVPKVNKRRWGHLTANLIVRLFNRLIGVGVLRKPSVPKETADGRTKVGYCVHWPEEESQTPGEKADVLQKRTSAITQYVSAGGENVIPLRQWLTLEAGYTEAEADSIIQDLAGAREGEDAAALLDQPAGLTAVVGLFDAAAKGSLTEDSLRAVLAELFGPGKADELLAGGLPEKPEPPQPPPGVPGSLQPGPGVPGQPGGQQPAPVATNAFCATGAGGGVDPSCSPGSASHRAAPELVQAARVMAAAHLLARGGAPDDPLFDVRQDAIDRSPALQKVAYKHQLAVEEYNRARIADLVKMTLEGHDDLKLPPPPKEGLSEGKVKHRVIQATDMEKGVPALADMLDPAGPYRRHVAELGAASPDARRAVQEAHRLLLQLGADARARADEYRAVVAQIRARKGTVRNQAADDFSDLESDPVTASALAGVLGAVRREYGDGGLAGFVFNVANVFCPTGQGGGVDPSCSPGGGQSAGVLGKDYVPEFSNRPYYHGSPDPVDKFHVPAHGLSFSDNEHHSREFGDHVQEVRLSVKKPLDLTHLGPGAGEEGDGVDERVSPAAVKAALAEHGIKVTFQRKTPGWTTDVLRPVMPDVVRQAAAKGYDALLVKDFKEFEADETVVFDQRQIKVVGRR